MGSVFGGAVGSCLKRTAVVAVGASVVFFSGGAWAAAVAVEAGPNGSASGGGDYAAGATATLTATPDSGYAFTRWEGDLGEASPLDNPLKIVVGAEDRSLTAVFGQKIVVASDGSGDHTTLEAAVDAANSNDVIVIKAGNYPIVDKNMNFFTISKAITILSESGDPKDVHLHGFGPWGSMSENIENNGYKLNHKYACLKGVTLRTFTSDGQKEGSQDLALRISNGFVENIVVYGCYGNHEQSAIRIDAGELRDSLIYGNTSKDRGEAAGLLAYGGLVRNCTIRSNSAPGCTVMVNGATARVVDCAIVSNTGGGTDGGGLKLVNGLVENCVISNNTGNSAGVYQTGGTLKGCTVTKNKAGYTQKYGGVNATGGTIENCGIYDNTAYYPDGMQLKMTGGTVRGTTAAAKLDAIPCSDFVSVASGVTVENCTFQCPSVNGSKELNATAYFTSNDVCWIEADKVVGKAPLTIAFKAHCPGATGYAWDFGDGASGSQEQNPTFTFANPSNYTVTLSCGTCDPVTLAVRALSNVAYCATDGGDVYPYDTPAKAAKNLQDAMDAVYADDEELGTVNVAAGTWNYTGSDVSKTFMPWQLVNRAVRVLGPKEGETLFDAKRKIMTLFLFHPRAVLERLTISNGRLDQSSQYGASLHMMNGLVTNCVISKGYCNFGGNASIRGGSIWNTSFLSGTLGQSGEDRPGGGLQLRGPSLVANCLFEGNVGGLGGGFSMHDSGAIVSNCVIRNNSGGLCCGGGVGLLKGLVTHCVITNNTSSQGAGGVRVSGGTLRNCLVANNRANGTGTMGVGYGKTGGGGITVSSGTAENCTVAYNTSASPTRSDELYQTGGTVRNCIFLGKDDTATYDVCKTGGTATYCCFRKGVTVSGTDNKSEDPKLTSPGADDFRPMFGSPAVDAGMEIAAVTSDLLGVARPIGDAYDMGCYEMDFSGKMGVSFDADITAAGKATVVTLTATVVGGTAPYTYRWTIGGKVYETDSNVFKHTFGYGSHDVTLVVVDANGTESDPVEQKGLVKIKASVVYVSTTGTAEWPYDTWEKATPDWNAAVGAVYATEEVPGRVWVADGTYTAHDAEIFTADLSLPIELCGTNPACKAVFDGQSVYHKVVKLNHAKSVLANVTITKCAANANGDCGCLWLYAGLATNCVFSGGTAWGAGNVSQSGGLMVDCVIRDHNAGTHSGGDRLGGGLYLSGGTAERCVISGCTDGMGGGAYVCGSTAVLRDSVIRNCFTSSGGALFLTAGLAERCVITNNTGSGSSSDDKSTITVKPGAGVYQSGGTLRNCLVHNNRTTLNSEATDAALYVANGTAYNNTVWANAMKNGETNDVYLAKGTVANTVAGTMTTVGGTAEGNYVGLAPGFRRPAKGDFRLKCGSPAIGIGVGSYWDGIDDPTDILGNPRFGVNHQLDAGCIQNRINGLSLIVR